ncbi:MAG: hypothetical protein JZD40_00435 [Sulfolobus sp.]|nr:hypothetical protein [Sulfolobus sp.]
MVLCQRCNKREAITVIGGRKVCEYCARDEIVKRVRKEIYETKQITYNDKVVIITDEQFKPVADLLKYIIEKACYKCRLQVSQVKIEVESNNINDLIWKLITESLKIQQKKILPFTSDFLLSYMIYSISMKDSNYLAFSSPSVAFNENIFLIPFYSTSIIELKGFAELKLMWKDESFNKIYSWVISYLNENYELFHTFYTSVKLFKKKTCKYCYAFIDEGDYCQRCKTFLTSPSPLY